MSVPPTADPATDHSRLWNHEMIPSAGVYTIDPVHTFVGFAGEHLWIKGVEVMQDGQVDCNLKGMDDLDFTGWNNAD